ncbi:hypothetical protein POM88_023691 [Heracleum sosnowskyi]|uniref:Uncharacterized protein n=1 Tax=Heracleum sosnowskyi TaxID=360622 RepID=A0AAD8II47_9APIA|nr:hypothetical protein POM88_023691 [Heracleum sosnowskyi]
MDADCVNLSSYAVQQVIAVSSLFSLKHLNDEKLQSVLGHFQKYFDGGVIVENQGAAFGGYGSFLPMHQRCPLVKMATRITAARYGVKLSPSFLVPSNWTGCLGVMNNYESLLPNQKALFDIPVARTASAYLTSLFLAVAAFVADGSFNGGDNALYIRHQFFFNNPLLSFIQFVIGPYTDNLGNVLPYTVEGVGVPVDPLAFAGLLEYFSALCSIGISPFIFMYISVCLKYLGHVQNTPRNVTPCPTLFVASLGPTASEQELVQVFSRCPGYLFSAILLHFCYQTAMFLQLNCTFLLFFC